MPHNDLSGYDAATIDSFKANTRALQNAAVRYHKKYPLTTMETAFEQVMSTASAFQALPPLCIEKARSYLALPNSEEVQAEFKRAPSEKLETIFTDLNEALQELADSGQTMFICGSPDASGLSPVLKEYNPQQIKVIVDTTEPPSVEPDDDIPCDGKQTVDFLTSTTKDLASVHCNHTLGYIFNSMCGSLSVLKTLRVVDVIEARKRLGLPTTLIDSVAQCREPDVYIPSHGTETVNHLVRRTNDIAKLHPDRAPRWIFDYVCHQMHEVKQLHTDDVYEARSRLGLLHDGKIKTKVSGPQVESSPTSKVGKSKQGTTVVHAERVVVDDKKMIKILKFENVCTKDNLPSAYLKGFPVFYTLGAYIVLSRTNGDLIGTKQFYENDILSCDDFGRMIDAMKEAAARLSKINKTAKLEREHSGEFMVSICDNR